MTFCVELILLTDMKYLKYRRALQKRVAWFSQIMLEVKLQAILKACWNSRVLNHLNFDDHKLITFCEIFNL